MLRLNEATDRLEVLQTVFEHGAVARVGADVLQDCLECLHVRLGAGPHEVGAKHLHETALQHKEYNNNNMVVT